MANFDIFKKKAAEAAETIADKSLVFARKAADKTKTVAKITKLTTDVAAEKEKIRQNYVELGKKYYELFKNEAAEELEQYVSDITASYETIAEKKAEIEVLKAKGSEEDDDIEVEIVEEEIDDSEGK